MSTSRYSYLFFRTVYLSAYVIFFLALVLLLAVTPGDHIYQTISNHKLGNVFVVGGTYLLTGLIAVFIYASRLYTNRTALAAIPKPYLPIEDGEISRSVRKMIVRNRERSALVLLQTKPRAHPVNVKDVEEQRIRRSTDSGRGRAGKSKAEKLPKNRVMEIDPQDPPWGTIVHPGWSPPDSENLPDLQFSTVISELPNLLEARAVSLTPPDRAFDFMAREERLPVQAPPDPEIVARLQRRPQQCLRNYLGSLLAMRIVRDECLVEDFLEVYEGARFSTDAVTEAEFHTLMLRFSNLLASVSEMDENQVEINPLTIRNDGNRQKQWPSLDNAAMRKLSAHNSDADTASLVTTESSQSVVRHLAHGPG